MKKSLLFAAAVCAAFAVSCNETILEETEPIQEPSLSEEVITLTCSLPETKVSIDAEGKTAWKKDDKIYVHGGKDEHTTVMLESSDISADGKTATIRFSGLTKYSGSSYKSSYYMIYPADAAGASHTMYYETRFNKFTEPVIGGYDDGEGHFITKNLCSVIRYKITTGEFDTYTFEGKNGETVGYEEYQVRLALKTDGTVDYRNTWSNGYAGSGTPLTLTSVSGSVATDGSYNYLVIPGSVSFSGGFIFKFKSGSTIVKTLSTSSSFSLKEGDLLDLGDVTAYLKDYVAPTVSDHESAITGATDLSTANGPANCYVISAPGAYKLPVVKGNNDEMSAGNVFGAQLLWETYNNAETVTANSVIAAVDFDGPTNYIYFETPATLKPGNALIAAKDSEGNIIWSWHIWIPSTTNSTVKDGDVSKDTFMDRNLGALTVTVAEETVVSPQAFGMLYQWGRKDPFVGAGAFNSSTKATVAGSANITTEDTSFNIADSYANPNTFAKFDSWLTGVEDWNPTGKSINDPCPPGYRVPDYDSSDLLWSSSVTGSALFDASSTYGWWKIGSLVFPLCGYSESGGSISHAYDRSRIISAQMLDSSYPEHCKAQYLYESSGAWKRTGDNRKRYAGSVRCVVDE